MQDPTKKEFAEELLSYTGTFSKAVTTSFKAEEISGAGESEHFLLVRFLLFNVSLCNATMVWTASGEAFDYIEKALSKFEDGPFFLGQFSLVSYITRSLVKIFESRIVNNDTWD